MGLLWIVHSTCSRNTWSRCVVQVGCMSTSPYQDVTSVSISKGCQKRKSCVRTILVATDQSSLPDIIDYLLPTSPLDYEGYALFLRIMCLVLQHLQVAVTCISGHYCVPPNGINAYWPTKPIQECESTLLQMLLVWFYNNLPFSKPWPWNIVPEMQNTTQTVLTHFMLFLKYLSAFCLSLWIFFNLKYFSAFC